MATGHGRVINRNQYAADLKKRLPGDFIRPERLYVMSGWLGFPQIEAVKIAVRSLVVVKPQLTAIEKEIEIEAPTEVRMAVLDENLDAVPDLTTRVKMYEEGLFGIAYGIKVMKQDSDRRMSITQGFLRDLIDEEFGDYLDQARQELPIRPELPVLPLLMPLHE